MQSPGEQFIVCPVGWVAALEHPLGQLHALQGNAEVVTAPLGGDHAHRQVLQRSGAIAAFRLLHFVGLPAALHLSTANPRPWLLGSSF